MTLDGLWLAIENEFLKMQKALSENRRLMAALENTQTNSALYDGVIAALAMNLQSFYTGAERIFQKISLNIDGSVPAGKSWHKMLLEQMSIETEFRPFLLSAETFPALNELLGFRHFVRNAYTYTLDAQKVLALTNALPTCYQNLRQDYSSFKQVLGSAADE